MVGKVEARASLVEVQRACDRAHAALKTVRLDYAPMNRPVRGLEQVTRVAAAGAATLFIACLAHMAD
ncbi:hypothetical protein [Breoghania sp. L-A4]|uniref:hypothetical protein n=1 Tax=Breoghania sp. L-A4 TaxID=2304600 RepID=UPI000E35904B|nr:hypothetical protein [Breoghania sp. L-A4]AXS40953.1 hypothetical protein D1F64_14100 [Breoghania sp. L-A4]